MKFTWSLGKWSMCDKGCTEDHPVKERNFTPCILLANSKNSPEIVQRELCEAEAFLLTVAVIKTRPSAKKNSTHSNPSEAGSYHRKVIFPPDFTVGRRGGGLQIVILSFCSLPRGFENPQGLICCFLGKHLL